MRLNAKIPSLKWLKKFEKEESYTAAIVNNVRRISERAYATRE